MHLCFHNESADGAESLLRPSLGAPPSRAVPPPQLPTPPYPCMQPQLGDEVGARVGKQENTEPLHCMLGNWKGSNKKPLRGYPPPYQVGYVHKNGKTERNLHNKPVHGERCD